MIIFLLYFFCGNWEKKFKRVIQLLELNQLEFDWFGFGQNLNQIKPIKINRFEFIFPSNPIRINPFTPLLFSTRI